MIMQISADILEIPTHEQIFTEVKGMYPNCRAICDDGSQIMGKNYHISESN